jgi:hypothetical protein
MEKRRAPCSHWELNCSSLVIMTKRMFMKPCAEDPRGDNFINMGDGGMNLWFSNNVKFLK